MFRPIADTGSGRSIVAPADDSQVDLSDGEKPLDEWCAEWLRGDERIDLPIDPAVFAPLSRDVTPSASGIAVPHIDEIRATTARALERIKGLPPVAPVQNDAIDLPPRKRLKTDNPNAAATPAVRKIGEKLFREAVLVKPRDSRWHRALLASTMSAELKASLDTGAGQPQGLVARLDVSALAAAGPIAIAGYLHQLCAALRGQIEFLRLGGNDASEVAGPIRKLPNLRGLDFGNSNLVGHAESWTDVRVGSLLPLLCGDGPSRLQALNLMGLWICDDSSVAELLNQHARLASVNFGRLRYRNRSCQSRAEKINNLLNCLARQQGSRVNREIRLLGLRGAIVQCYFGIDYRRYQSLLDCLQVKVLARFPNLRLLDIAELADLNGIGIVDEEFERLKQDLGPYYPRLTVITTCAESEKIDWLDESQFAD